MKYERVGAILPRPLVESFRKELEYLGIDVSERSFLGFLVLFGLGISTGVSLNLFFFLGFPVFISIPVVFVLFLAGVYVWLSIASESKGKFVEKILPDALQLIASNIKSGLTTERALFVSARPEFGPLEKELKLASKEILAGKRIDIALLELPTRIRSKVLERTVWLISKGIQSGGQIADLLMKLSDDLREQRSIQEEVKANVSMYVLLIFFASAIGAPMLLGISSFIVEILGSQSSIIDPEDLSGFQSAGSAGQFVAVGDQESLSVEFIVFFSSILILVGAVFASMTMGTINTGKEKNGLKYLPLLLLISFALFFAVRFGLTTFFADLL